MKQFDEIRAVFAPLSTDDLKPGSRAFIGRSGIWYAAWRIEDGDYEGQWAMVPKEAGWPFHWAAECDLELIAEMNGG